METPDWNKGDRIRSIIEVTNIVQFALAECVVDTGKWISKKLKEHTDDTTSK